MLPLVGMLMPVVGKLIDKFIPDPIEAAKAKAELLSQENAAFFKELELQASVVLQEAKSEHWLTANWRPVTMLTFVAIIANNYIIYPYLALFFADAPLLPIPPDMWDLLKIGLGGYVVGRSAEKVVKELANGKKEGKK